MMTRFLHPDFFIPHSKFLNMNIENSVLPPFYEVVSCLSTWSCQFGFKNEPIGYWPGRTRPVTKNLSSSNSVLSKECHAHFAEDVLGESICEEHEHTIEKQGLSTTQRMFHLNIYSNLFM